MKNIKTMVAGALAIVFLSVVLFGCACPRTDTTGVTTKNFTNCLLADQDEVCNPPASVMAVIDAAAPIIAAIVNVAVPGSAAWVTATTMKNAITSVQTVGCLSVSTLNELIAYIQSAAFTQQVATMRAEGKYMAVPVIDVGPLVDWRDSGKK